MRPWPVSCLVGVLALALAGCGTGATIQNRPARTQVFGRDAHRLSRGRFVHRPGLSGGDFLIPAAMDFSYVDLVSEPVLFGDTTTSLNDVSASVRATITAPDHIELLATGRAGTLARLGWEETCTRAGVVAGADGALSGASRVTALIPAVIKLEMPSGSGGRDACRVAAMLYTSAPTRAALALVNY